MEMTPWHHKLQLRLTQSQVKQLIVLKVRVAKKEGVLEATAEAMEEVMEVMEHEEVTEDEVVVDAVEDDTSLMVHLKVEDGQLRLSIPAPQLAHLGVLQDLVHNLLMEIHPAGKCKIQCRV